MTEKPSNATLVSDDASRFFKALTEEERKPALKPNDLGPFLANPTSEEEEALKDLLQ